LNFVGKGLICREEHFYQLGLRQFGAFNRLRLDPPPLLRDLISLAAEDEPGIQENNLDLNEVVEVSRLVHGQWLMTVNNESPTR
jgi:hypothetical protein